MEAYIGADSARTAEATMAPIDTERAQALQQHAQQLTRQETPIQ